MFSDQCAFKVLSIITSGMLIFTPSLAVSQDMEAMWPKVSSMDDVGVNQLSGYAFIPQPTLATAGMTRTGWDISGWPSTGPARFLPYLDTNLSGISYIDEMRVGVIFRGSSERFSMSQRWENGNWVGMNYTPEVGGRGTLKEIEGFRYQYRTPDGVEVIFDSHINACDTNNVCRYTNTDGMNIGIAAATSITYPNGEVHLLSYWKSQGNRLLLASVNSSAGWSTLYDYNAKISGTNIEASGSVRIVNTSAVYCTEYLSIYIATHDCGINPSGQLFPHFNFSVQKENPNLAGNYQYEAWDTQGPLVKAASRKYVLSAMDRRVDYTWFLDSGNNYNGIKHVDIGGKRYSYWGTEHKKTPLFGNRPRNPQIITRQDPLGNRTEMEVESYVYPSEFKNASGKTTKYEYSSDGFVTKIIYPEGGYDKFEYSDRKLVSSYNITASGSSIQTMSASYPTCNESNYRICNKPMWVIDARGNRTDYTYYPEHGGVRNVTGPADNSGVRPQTRHEYTALYAQIKNSAGVLVNASAPIYKLTKTSTCSAADYGNPGACVGAMHEQVKEFVYAHPNLLLTSETTRAGDNSTSETITYFYDEAGNVVTIDGPRTDVDDRTFVTYSLRGKKLMEISPDPDGSGDRKRSVVRHEYDHDGLETRTEAGSCRDVTYANAIPSGCTEYAWSSAKKMTYDTTGQLVKMEVVVP